MKLVATNILNGKRIDCYIPYKLLNKISGFANINIVKVNEFYDYNIGDIKTEYNIENEMIHLKFDLNNVSNGEIFIITQIILDNSYVIGKKNTDFPIGYILIDENNNMQNAKELFNIIRRKREEIFNLPIGDINENNSYQVLIFCKDIYADACAQYGQIQITPYKNLGYESEIKYINNFFKHCQTNININLNEKDILESHFRPSAIIHIPNVIANNIQRAEEISLNKASILINIFSLLKKSHGSFFAIFINHKNNGKHYFKFLDGEYRGNLIPGTISGENGEIIRQYNQVLSESPSEMNVFIQLLNDYIKENNIMMKYYRLWEIIEGFARKQNICNKLVKDWNGNIFRNKKGKKMQITEAKQYVFEVLRLNFGNINENEFMEELKDIISIQDFITIWYQRRNCCAHQGGCFENNIKICDPSNEKCIICKKNKYEIKSIFEDKILNKAEKCVFDIINKHMEKICNVKCLWNIELRQHYDNGKFIEL